MIILGLAEDQPVVARRLIVFFRNSQNQYVNYRLVDRMLRHRIYSRRMARFAERVLAGRDEINANFRACDLYVQNYGYHSPGIIRAAEKLQRPSVWRALTRSQKARLAVVLFKLGRHEANARELAREAGLAAIERGFGSVYLCHKVAAMPEFNSPYVEISAAMYENSQRAQSEFERRIREAKGDFCVVGNGSSEAGTKNGRRIDGFSCVIRINNYSLDFSEDYGTKHDIWVRVANKEVISRSANDHEMVVIAANNFEFRRKDAYEYMLSAYLANQPLAVIPPFVYLELNKMLRGLPSTGMAILYWIFLIQGPISRANIFGFTHLTADNVFSRHYFQDSGSGVEHRHEWKAERRLLNAITH